MWSKCFVWTTCWWFRENRNVYQCGMPFIKKVKLKWTSYRPGLAQKVGRGIVLLFHDRGTRRAWVVSSTPRPHFNPGKGPVPILQEAGWAPGPVWKGGKSRPHRDSIPNQPVVSRCTDWATGPKAWHLLNRDFLTNLFYCYFTWMFL